MTAQILGYVLHLPNIVALLITLLFTTSYVMYGGYTSDLATDVFYFFLMFIGLAAVLYFLHSNYGGISFLDRTLPPAHLSLTGGSTTGFIIVWWIIAVWTFADPGFYQRIQSARSHRIAIYGIIFSILLWFLFDFLTNAIGLYTRAIVPILANPSEAFLELAQGKLPDGLRGFFIVAMLATILSTLNSFLLISGMTFSKEIFVHPALRKMRKPQNEVSQIRFSILISGITAVFICLLIPSVIQMWYTLGSLFIPGIIFLLLSCYYDGFSISSRFARLEWYMSFLTGFTWWVCRDVFHVTNALFSIEPMFAGLIAAGTFHLTGLFLQKKAEG
jgi:SSS family solute:Na+ symporter